MLTYSTTINALPANGIFVFGSNTEGRHGKGAALVAKQRFGAISGIPQGLCGRSYAIITKDLRQNIHPSICPDDIIAQIKELYKLAFSLPDYNFYIAYSGTKINLNGYTSDEMASFFSWVDEIPKNIVFETEFYKKVYNYYTTS